MYNKKYLNLVLGGGGVKGIAYAGVFEVAEQRKYRWANIVGVSAGAIAGSYAGAGYRSDELLNALEAFDLKKIDLSNLHKKIPAISRYIEFINESRFYRSGSFRSFLEMAPAHGPEDRSKEVSGEKTGQVSGETLQFANYRGNFFKNIITYAKEGCLFDGDYVEEWFSKMLSVKGFRTFADLRGGIPDKTNPNGYKMRMTAVDCNRAKVLILPDDIAFYGIDPDKFEIARGIRMSTCVPFVFKSVDIKKQEGKSMKVYHIVDGGVLDSFPSWSIDNPYQTIGFTLNGGGKNKFFSIDTPLNILKGLISAVHDIGVPKNPANKVKYIGEINTSKVSFLDFNLNDGEKDYLYNTGKQNAIGVFNSFESQFGNRKGFLRRLLGWR